MSAVGAIRIGMELVQITATSRITRLHAVSVNVSLPGRLRTSITVCPWNTVGGVTSGSTGPLAAIRLVRLFAGLRRFLAQKNAQKTFIDRK